MAGTANALQRHGNRARRADLADKIDVADVDAELERRSRDEHAHFAGFQLAFGSQAQLAREAAVMGGNCFFSEAFGEMVRDAFGKPPRIDEDQRGTMLQDERGDAVVNFAPHLVGGDRAEFALGDFDRDVQAAAVTGIDDYGVRPAIAGKKVRDGLDRLLRGGKADADGRMLEQGFEPLERKRQMRAAFIVGDGVDFIHDHGFDVAQDGAASLGGEQDVERFGRGNENVRRPHQHVAAFVHQGVAGTHADANFGHQQAAFGGFAKNFAQRDLEIFLDVVAEGLQRRDVQNFRLISQRTGKSFADQPVDAGEKGGERFAGAGRRGNYRGFPGEDLRPAELLRLGGRSEALQEPFADDGMGPVECARSAGVRCEEVGSGIGGSHLLIVTRRRTKCEEHRKSAVERRSLEVISPAAVFHVRLYVCVCARAESACFAEASSSSA